jgi:hypothetical protein
MYKYWSSVETDMYCIRYHTKRCIGCIEYEILIITIYMNYTNLFSLCYICPYCDLLFFI